MPFSTLKAGFYATLARVDYALTVNVSGVMNVFIVMETDKKGRCKSISRLVVFGAGETVNFS
ncbi:hypothetical protein BGX21_007109 [Mortierella sp. AD011]|nr:hypothetical protein BGX21_007109 [Mortierella sp. AD011]